MSFAYGFGAAPAGLVSFPAGTYNAEPPGSLPSTQLQPNLGMSFDRPLQKWVPVRREQVSPDGRAYAYVDFPSRSGGPPVSDGVHVVDAATGRDRLVVPNRPPPAPPWFVVGLDARGLYLAGREPWSGGHPPSSPIGLALADAASGRVRPITDSGSWMYVGGGAGWGMTTPLGQPAAGRGSQLVRLDLATGSEQVWLTRHRDLQLVGIDGSGHPLVELNSVSAGTNIDHAALWLVQAPGQATELRSAGGLDPPQVLGAGSLLEDGHGIWITAANPELWLYSPQTGLRLMHRFEDGITRLLAGTCS